MNKIIKYICIVIIIFFGLFFLFSGVFIKEGYTNKATHYANAVESGRIGVTKPAITFDRSMKGNDELNSREITGYNSDGRPILSMAGYGSNGIATKGYDGNGYAILDYNQNGAPIIAYKDNNPVLGTPTPTSTTNIPQLGPIGNVDGLNSNTNSVVPDYRSTSQQITLTSSESTQPGSVQRYNF
jgi:hypothetical protein